MSTWWGVLTRNRSILLTRPSSRDKNSVSSCSDLQIWVINKNGTFTLFMNFISVHFFLCFYDPTEFLVLFFFGGFSEMKTLRFLALEIPYVFLFFMFMFI